eukprot:2333583-Pleurochrysis_carterae.AAC.1
MDLRMNLRMDLRKRMRRHASCARTHLRLRTHVPVLALVCVHAIARDHKRARAWLLLRACSHAIAHVRASERARARASEGQCPTCMRLREGQPRRAARGRLVCLRAASRLGATSDALTKRRWRQSAVFSRSESHTVKDHADDCAADDDDDADDDSDDGDDDDGDDDGDSNVTADGDEATDAARAASSDGFAPDAVAAAPAARALTPYLIAKAAFAFSATASHSRHDLGEMVALSNLAATMQGSTASAFAPNWSG